MNCKNYNIFIIRLFIFFKFNKLLGKQTLRSEMQQSTQNFIYFLAVIGAIFFAVFIGKLLWIVVKMILPQKNYMQRYGRNSWVVVTGGSDGIGLGFCEQFAALGFNICMIARNQQKMIAALQKIRNSCEQQIKTQYVVAEFGKSAQQQFFSRIFEQLTNKGILNDLAILVNNVGISNIGYLHQLPDQRLLNQITINCVPCVLMSNYAIPHMLKRQRRSAIINVSSFAGQMPTPYVSNYSATKAFVDAFSKAVSLEYSNHIDILSTRPMLVQSNMSKQEASCTVATRNQFAKACIKYLALDYETNGYWVHRLIVYLVNCLPTALSRGMAESEARKLMEKQNGKKTSNL